MQDYLDYLLLSLPAALGLKRQGSWTSDIGRILFEHLLGDASNVGAHPMSLSEIILRSYP